MLKQMLETIHTHNMISKNDKVVVGVSGGPDSIALLHALYHLKECLDISLIVVHVNHMLRGVLADIDEDYVRAFCNERDIVFYSYKVDVQDYAKEMGLSFEDAGRRVRYQKFLNALELENADKIAIAQNRNDLVETFFINLLRGSGIDGLASIEYVRDGIYIRPLLDVDRTSIEAYCNENKLNPRIDHTNSECDYLRNRIRNELLPILRSGYNPSVDQTLYKTIQIMKCEKDFWTFHSMQIFEKHCKANDGNVTIEKKSFYELHEAEQLQLLRYSIQIVRGNLTNVTSAILYRIKKLSKTGTFVMIDVDHRVRLSYDELIVERVEADCEVDMELPEIFKYEISKCNYSKIKHLLKNIECIAVDASKVCGELIARHRRDGDTFIPLGMNGHKKVKDFFIDLKIPKEDRNKIWLVCDNEKIIWVHGIRMDNRCRVLDETENILLISFVDIVEIVELC